MFGVIFGLVCGISRQAGSALLITTFPTHFRLEPKAHCLGTLTQTSRLGCTMAPAYTRYTRIRRLICVFYIHFSERMRGYTRILFDFLVLFQSYFYFLKYQDNLLKHQENIRIQNRCLGVLVRLSSFWCSYYTSSREISFFSKIFSYLLFSTITSLLFNYQKVSFMRNLLYQINLRRDGEGVQER